MKKKYLSITNSFLEGNQRENWEKAKSQGYSGAVTNIECAFEDIDDNSFNVVMSTPKENRNGYEILQNFSLANFKKNPVLLNGHNSDRVNDILGKVENLKKKDGKLHGKIIFDIESYDGFEAYRKAKNGFLNAVSITIMPLEFGDDGEITKSEVLELSCVPVPADPETLIVRNNKEIKNCKECIEDKKEEEGEEAVQMCTIDETLPETSKSLNCPKIEETKKEQILRILENKKNKEIEIKKETLAVLNRLRNHPTVDKDDELVKMANRCKKLTKKL